MHLSSVPLERDLWKNRCLLDPQRHRAARRRRQVRHLRRHRRRWGRVRHLHRLRQVRREPRWVFALLDAAIRALSASSHTHASTSTLAHSCARSLSHALTTLNRSSAATDESRTAGCTNGRGAAAEPGRLAASPTERGSRAAAARFGWAAASACWAT